MKSLLLALFAWSLAFPAFARADEFAGWRFNFTPALVSQSAEYGLGGGIDPEVRYGIGIAGTYLSMGARAGAYYAKNTFGTLAMPTVRLTIPLASWEAYGAFGAGFGWIPKTKESDTAEMYRAGLCYHFSRTTSLGAEATYQEITHTNFRFLSLGSMISFGL